TAMAVASPYAYSSNRCTISTGAISVLNGMLPETKTTDPYSPSARANARANPVVRAGYKGGNRTGRNGCQRVAPRIAAASSGPPSSVARTGCTVRTTNGKPVNVSTSTIASREYAASMPRGCRNRPIQPLGTYRLEYTSPATAVGSANGRST